MAEKNAKITPFQEEQIKAAKKICEYKLACEANVVSILYKTPNMFYDTNLKLEELSNNIWKVYFQIGYDIIMVENKVSLDDITVGLYLEKHSKLQSKYDEYGGYETIQKACEYVKPENLFGYIEELRKWNAVLKLNKLGFPVCERLSEYADMTADEIYNTLEANLNHTFVNIDSDIKSYKLCDGIEALIDKLDTGERIGMPYYNLPTVSKETGGQYLGGITLIGGISDSGKSTFVRNTIIPSVLKEKERVVIIINEDALEKWQREFLVWTCNNILKFDIQKHTVRDGKYSPEVKDALHRAAKWLKEQEEGNIITVLPFPRYQTPKAIKIIKKYASMGVKYFILDTFKADAGYVSSDNWMHMQQAMVDIADIVKGEAHNLHIAITVQLDKASAKQRYFTLNNIGMAKNIVDPVKTCIMIRNLYSDEYTGEPKELKVYKFEGKNGKTKIPVKLNSDCRYQIIFITKNKEGAANSYQIVVKTDMSRNTMEEVGVCNVPIDFS